MPEQNARPIDPGWAWQPYRPSDDVPWNLPRVGHLYRRAAFGATHAELEEGLRAGPERVLDRLFEGGAGQVEFEQFLAELGRSIAEGNNGQQLKGLWVYRLLYSPHPLREKLALFWHNHFATSNAKVLNAGFMLGQQALLRRHALGSFRQMLLEISRDPAMVIWLDTRGSKKGNPNENYARELMELFSLGIGHYTENDIREAARAFTGWEISGTEVVFEAKEHDAGAKTVLGQTGNWKGEDIVRICLEQKASARFLAGKLFRFLVSETVPATPELLEPLAEQLRGGDQALGPVVRTILRSNLFHSPQVYRTRVKSPVDFVLGIVRGLEGRVGANPLVPALEQLGQSPFYPPSVKGWDGGPAWLNGQTLLHRQNLALALTSTEDPRFGTRTDPAALLRKYGKQTDAEVVDFLLALFLQGDVAPAARQRLLDYLRSARDRKRPVYWTDADAADQRVRAVCHLVLTLPEFQLD